MLDTKRKPYSILMSKAERHHIAQQASLIGITAPEFIRTAALNKDIEKALRKMKMQELDKREAVQILGALGRSNIPSNLNQIARSIKTGTFVFSIDTQRHITEAYELMLWIRDFLIRQQGIKP